MIAVFCCDPSRPSQVDPDWTREADAASAAGFSIALLDHDAAERGAPTFHRLPASGAGVVYRGWMLRAERYARVQADLVAAGHSPLTSPEAYRRCHHLPEAYPILASGTPRTVWIPIAEMSDARIAAALASFGNRPAIVKDYVKSRKHEWAEACFIPDASDASSALRVVRRFLELQGSDLAGGLVLREFVELEIAARHPDSGMPLAREHRFFVVDGEVAVSIPYWDEVDTRVDPPDPGPFLAMARGLGSRFFTLDVARTRAGDWIVVEPGDGQVAGLPLSADPRPLWDALAAAVSNLA